jgi:hypothetical protein
LETLSYSAFVESEREKLFTARQSPEPAGGAGCRNHTDQIMRNRLLIIIK